MIIVCGDESRCGTLNDKSDYDTYPSSGVNSSFLKTKPVHGPDPCSENLSSIDIQMQDTAIQKCGPEIKIVAVDVAPIGIETSLKTKLKSQWTLWMDKSIRGESAAEFESHVKRLCIMKTYEEFWSVYNTVPEITELCFDHSYHFMKGERRPVWEDEENRNGGAWKFRCTKDTSAEVWKKLIIAAVEGHFLDCCLPGDQIVAISVTVRENEDVVQVWNTNAMLAPKSKLIRKARQIVPDVTFRGIFYKPFSEHLGFARRDSVMLSTGQEEIRFAAELERAKSPEDFNVMDDVVSAQFDLAHRRIMPKWLLPSTQHPMNNPLLLRNKHPLGRRPQIRHYNLFPPFMSVRPGIFPVDRTGPIPEMNESPIPMAPLPASLYTRASLPHVL